MVSRKAVVLTGAFGSSYKVAYRRLLSYGVPRWLVIRAKGKSPVDVESAPLRAG